MVAALKASSTAFAAETLKTIARNSPLSMAATLRLVRMNRAEGNIRAALTNEFRFTWRASDQGDFLEGVRAQIIDKDRNPNWKNTLADLREEDVAAMLAPLGPNAAIWEE